MKDLVVAVGLVLVIEGILYAAFTDQLKAMIAQILKMPATTIRTSGLVVAALGILIIWLARG